MPVGIYIRNPSEKERLKKGAHTGIPTSKEAKNKLSLALKGNKNMLGRHHSEETKRKMSLAQKKHLLQHPEKLEKMRMINCGEKSHLWKGGITPENIAIRRSLKYIEWRRKVFTRDFFVCQECKQIGGKLHAHHKKRFSTFMEEIKYNLPLLPLYEAAMIYKPLWDIENGITLCKKCHSKKGTKIARR